MGAIRIKAWKRGAGAKGRTVCEKTAFLALSAMGSDARLYVDARFREAGGATPGLFVVDGTFKGRRHRVLVRDASAPKGRTKALLNRLSELKDSMNADAAFACFAEGISGDVLLMAEALGIMAIEGAEIGPAAHAHLGPSRVERHVSIQAWVMSLFQSAREGKGLSIDGDSRDCFFRGRPVRNWLFRESRKLMQQAERDCMITVRYRLKRPLAFEVQGNGIKAKGLEVRFSCSVTDRVGTRMAELKALRYHPGLARLVERKDGGGPRASKRGKGGVPLLPGPDGVSPGLFIYYPVTASERQGMPAIQGEIRDRKVRIAYG